MHPEGPSICCLWSSCGMVEDLAAVAEVWVAEVHFVRVAVLQILVFAVVLAAPRYSSPSLGPKRSGPSAEMDRNRAAVIVQLSMESSRVIE